VANDVVILAGGPGRVEQVVLPADAFVIVADGGARRAVDSGLHVGLLVGDLDSISDRELAALERAGALVERHAAEKDATDLELALAAALRFEPERILVVGSAGGRLDHLLGSLLTLAAETYAGVRVDAQFGAAAVHVVRDERTLPGERGELISLFAVHEPAGGVVTEGLVYPLHGETLEPGSSRGLSNVFAAPQARIVLERGVLLAVRPTGNATAGG
jgi:thiamine pyrophosphokinase